MNPWTINVRHPSKGNPFAGCGWHSIYSTVGNGSLYCWDKATVLLLYNQSKKTKTKRMSRIWKALIAVVSAQAKLSILGNSGHVVAWCGGQPRAQRTLPDSCSFWPTRLMGANGGSISSAESTAVQTWNDVSDTQWHADIRLQRGTWFLA